MRIKTIHLNDEEPAAVLAELTRAGQMLSRFWNEGVNEAINPDAY